MRVKELTHRYRMDRDESLPPYGDRQIYRGTQGQNGCGFLSADAYNVDLTGPATVAAWGLLWQIGPNRTSDCAYWVNQRQRAIFNYCLGHLILLWFDKEPDFLEELRFFHDNVYGVRPLVDSAVVQRVVEAHLATRCAAAKQASSMMDEIRQQEDARVLASMRRAAGLTVRMLLLIEVDAEDAAEHPPASLTGPADIPACCVVAARTATPDDERLFGPA